VQADGPDGQSLTVRILAVKAAEADTTTTVER
jgi:hypothetical protein